MQFYTEQRDVKSIYKAFKSAVEKNMNVKVEKCLNFNCFMFLYVSKVMLMVMGV